MLFFKSQTKRKVGPRIHMHMNLITDLEIFLVSEKGFLTLGNSEGTYLMHFYIPGSNCFFLNDSCFWDYLFSPVLCGDIWEGFDLGYQIFCCIRGTPNNISIN